MEISDNHTNQVYCRCSLCAENGYGGAWVSRNTRSRHMKTERANRYQYSKPLNSELTSDDANTSSSTETQMSILEDNEYNTDNSTEIQIPIEDSLRFFKLYNYYNCNLFTLLNKIFIILVVLLQKMIM